MENGIDLDLAREVLTMAALLPMSLEPLGNTLAEVARERELEILPMDFTRGRYFGFVVGVDGRQCLVEHKAKGAICWIWMRYLRGKCSRVGAIRFSSRRDMA